MSWYSDKGDQLPNDEYGLRMRVALDDHLKFIRFMAGIYDTIQKESLEELIHLGVVTLWDTVVACTCEHPMWEHLPCPCGEVHCARDVRGRQCGCISPKLLSVKEPAFEKWFKTRLDHRLKDQTAIWKPRRSQTCTRCKASITKKKPLCPTGEKHTPEITEPRPFSVEVVRTPRPVDVLGVSDVQLVMAVYQELGDPENLTTRHYVEGLDFEVVTLKNTLTRIKWLTDDAPVPGTRYQVQGSYAYTYLPKVEPGMRDPRLEVAGTEWSHFGRSDAGPTQQEAIATNEYLATPEETGITDEGFEHYEFFRECLLARVDKDTQVLKLIRAMSVDTLNLQEDGAAKSPERRLMKILNWTRRDLQKVMEKLRVAIEETKAEMEDGMDVDNMAMHFLRYGLEGKKR